MWDQHPPLTCSFAVMIHVADKGFVNKGECWTMTKMMKCFPKVSSLIEKKKKKKWWRGCFWLGDPSSAVNLQSNLYSPSLYSVGNDWFSFPLENHVISQKYLPSHAKDDECSPITSYFFTNFAYQNSFLQFLIVCFVLLATQARYRTPMPRY